MNTSRRCLLRAGAVVLLARAVVDSSPGALAQPPPPNPSDDDLAAGRAGVSSVDAELGRLSAELDTATAALDAAHAELGATLAVADAALTDRDTARSAADTAETTASAAADGQAVADGLAADAQVKLDVFVAASYRQGSVVGSTSGYLGSENPEAVLDRAEMLDAMGSEQRSALDALERAQVAKANQDSIARAALAEAERRRRAAEEATVVAQAAYDDAVVASAVATTRNVGLLSAQADTQQRLAIAQQALTGLNGQRRTFEEWVVERQRQEAAAAAQAAADARARQVALDEAAEAARQQARQQAEVARQAQAQAPPPAQAPAQAQAPAPRQAQAPAREPERAGRAPQRSAEPDPPRQSDEGAPPPPAAPPVSVRPPSASGAVAPANGWLSSYFGPRGGSIHYGIDVANSTGTPIVSVRSGTVVDAGPAAGFGLWVRVRHDDATVTTYGHNDRNLVTIGQRVSVGQQIATIGNRGESSGPHLHFEVAPGGGAKVDPLTWLRSRGVAV